MTIVPFRPWLPAPDQAQAVVSPPFDVPTRAEAAAMAQGDERNFLHVVRAEVDLPAEVDAHDSQVYEKARRNLAGLQVQGVLGQGTAARNSISTGWKTGRTGRPASSPACALPTTGAG